MQIKLLDMKATIPEMKNTPYGDNRSDAIDEYISEFSDLELETIQKETQKENKIGRKWTDFPGVVKHLQVT